VLQRHEKELQGRFHAWVADLSRIQREHSQQCAELIGRLRRGSGMFAPEPELQAAPPPAPPPAMTQVPPSTAPAWMEPEPPEPRGFGRHVEMATDPRGAVLDHEAPPLQERTRASSRSRSRELLSRMPSSPQSTEDLKTAPVQADAPTTEISARKRFSDPMVLLYDKERQASQRSKSRSSLTKTPNFAPTTAEPDEGGRLRDFVRSTGFRAAASMMIAANAIFLGVHADQVLQSLILGDNRMGESWEMAEVVFAAFFTLELLLRLVAERKNFLIGEDAAWNVLDTALVMLSLLDILLSNTALNLTFARTLRVFRFARILRIVRVMRIFYSFRLMVYSVIYSIVSLLWVFFMLVFVMYFFAIFFLNGVAEEFRTGDLDEGIRGDLATNYGSLAKALLSLFMGISGGVDWIELHQPLAEIHWSYGIVFLVYIFFMIFGVLNVVMATFVDSASQISRRDRELVTQNEMEKITQYARNVQRFFHEADVDGTGTLSLEEFEKYLGDEKVQAYFQSFELDVTQARTLFNLLDLDESNDVGIDEFVEGCMRMKGSARSIDVNMLLYENEKMIERQITFMSYVEEQFSMLWAAQGLPPQNSQSQPLMKAKESIKNRRSRRVQLRTGTAGNLLA